MSSENYRIGDQNACYFVTLAVTDWVDVFTQLNYRNIITDSLDYCRKNKGMKLYAWCLMTNHIHIVCTVEPPFTMSGFLRDFKKHTAKTIHKDIQPLPESRRD